MDSNDATSRSLLVRVKANDQDAWRRQVDLYSPLVTYWCRRGGASPEDLPDLVQEVFAALAPGLGTYRPDRPRASFRGWLRGIVKHKLSDHFRRGPALAEGGSDAFNRVQGVAAAVEPDLSESDAEIAALYRRAIDQIRAQFEERTWDAFWRVAMEGRTPAEVAAELGLSPNTVRQAKSRVLRRLKQELGELIA